MRSKIQKALADANSTIRDLRHQLAASAQPLRVQIRELEVQLAASERRRADGDVRELVLVEQNRVRENLIRALLDYQRISGGKTGPT